MLKPIFALMVLFCGFNAHAGIGIRVAAKATDVAKATAWMHAMEARADGGVLSSPVPSLGGFTAWLGWGLALVSFAALIIAHVRERRHHAHLARAGERDDFIWRRPL